MKLLKILFACFFALAVSSAVVAELYRWVDANGQVHYSDTPQAGAEEIELRETNSFPGRSTASTSLSEVESESFQDTELDDSGTESFTGYQSATISSPDDGAVLWNIGGVLNVNLSLTPSLQKGHGVVFFYDGRPVNSKPVPTTSVTLEDVYRGAHTVRASVYSAAGDLLMNGSTNSFQVMQGTAN